MMGRAPEALAGSQRGHERCPELGMPLDGPLGRWAIEGSNHDPGLF